MKITWFPKANTHDFGSLIEETVDPVLFCPFEKEFKPVTLLFNHSHDFNPLRKAFQSPDGMAFSDEHNKLWHGT